MFFNIFDSIVSNRQLASSLHIFIISLLFSLILTPLMRILGKGLNILDVPNERKIHKKPTPLLGGLAIYMAFAIAVIHNFDFSREMKGVAIGGTIILLMGLLDDIRELPSTLRLFGQLLSVSIVMLFGVRLSFLPNNPWGNIGEILLTIIWVIGISNALNFFDGMDGLAAGCAVIQAFFLSIVAHQTRQHYLGYLSVALVGSSLGFLPYNFRPRRPATIFLGDSGSTFLGFTLASLAIMSNWAANHPLKAFSAPVLIMGVLIFDMVYITISRIVTKKVSTFKELLDYVGKDHLHHRLNSIGLNKKQTVLFIYLINICLGISAVVLLNVRTIDVILLIFQAVAIGLIISILEILGNKNTENQKIMN